MQTLSIVSEMCGIKLALLIASNVVLGPQAEPVDSTTWHLKVFVPIRHA
jgi:hypothetical protein